MVAVKKTVVQNPDDPNVRDPEHAHELGGTLGMTIGGVAGGIAAGAAAGATIGTATAGPIGAVVGAAIGGAIGGSAGESVARDVNPTVEEQYWSDTYTTRPYVKSGSDFETYRPAYRHGINAYTKSQGKSFDDLEPSIRNDWGNARGTSTMEWDEARAPARDAFERLQQSKK